MRSLVITALVSCMATLCLTSLGFWAWTRISQGGVAPPSPPESRRDDQADVKSHAPTEKAVTFPSPYEMPMEMVFFGDKQFSPCYVDLPNKVLYRWKDVVLRRDQLPAGYTRAISGLAMFDPKDFAEVVPINALVKYREIDCEYRPGYLFTPAQTFFEWKGVKLKRDKVFPTSQDGKNAVVPLDAVGQTIDIDMPVFLKDQPGLWHSP
jgi:hypothetical protein